MISTQGRIKTVKGINGTHGDLAEARTHNTSVSHTTFPTWGALHIMLQHLVLNDNRITTKKGHQNNSNRTMILQRVSLGCSTPGTYKPRLNCHQSQSGSATNILSMPLPVPHQSSTQRPLNGIPGKRDLYR